MTARYLPRELGVIISCNEDGCGARIQTANVLIRVNRRAAARDGWIRGGKGRARNDYCPTCAPLEYARVSEEKRVIAERKAARAAAKLKKFAPPIATEAASSLAPS